MDQAHGIEPTLQNVVCTVNLGCKLDLKEIALQARNAEYNPKRFAAVIMRIREPKTTALIFASGKMVCTGAKSEDDARTAARKYAKIIQKVGYHSAKFMDFKIQNMVGSCDVKFPIRLEGLAHSHKSFANYEPELFPGLIYRMLQPKVVLLIFVSGKVVLTGAKSRADIQTAFDNIYPILQGFSKNRPLVPLASEPVAALPAAGGSGSAPMQVDEPEQRMLPPPSPAHGLPPPSPAHGHNMHMLPPPSPAHH
mmetsp:Transcript_4907/g.8535  ORF Transcript_4907/g.8535 Transcript_4907/m.8535 type:complete len:252 (-) Transcript_4907:1535-2290(-)